ncbi:MAG: hypothetical protein JXB25_01935, partial [Deltaproteobacteria bacterium]|nr:hypothetical protein [Deltaproteobacteria bacterium]
APKKEAKKGAPLTSPAQGRRVPSMPPPVRGAAKTPCGQTVCRSMKSTRTGTGIPAASTMGMKSVGSKNKVKSRGSKAEGQMIFSPGFGFAGGRVFSEYTLGLSKTVFIKL